ncbi:MAG: beta-lactamase family protein, partial [Algicola sp.]|nr:beta-lactamase family protein [Algicola sp.]
MSRFSLLLCCWFSLGFTALAQTVDLHKQVQQVLDEENLVGASWALIDHEQITLGSVGFANKAKNIALLPSNKLHVGSITKTLLASGVLVLVSAGELSLDAKVSNLLTGIHFDNPWQATHPVLVRHLLDHTSGLQDARFWHLFNTRAKADSPLQRIFEIEPSLLKVRTQPGSQFGYSNLSFNLLAMVIEAVTGSRYEVALATRLLKPLGMSDSSFHFTGQTGDSLDPRLAYGHLDRGDLIAAIPGYLRGAGQFTTTPGDMVTFMQFLLGEGNNLVTPQLVLQMGQVAQTDSRINGLNAGGGHGLWRRDRHGVVGLCHGGNTLGFRGMLCVFPEQQKGFFVMVNADSETADYGRLDQLMIAALGVKPALKPTKKAGDYQQWLGWYKPVSFG